MFQRFFDEGLAQGSFLIGCDRTKQAVVIDPRRDAAIYAAAARQHGATIVAAIETHIHADFVSGARELAATGARVIAGPGAGLEFPYHEAADNERLELGDLALTFLHTPGHTPEHITIFAEHPGQAPRLFTGDLLFVGAVGRPDLLGEAQTRQLAQDLHRSLTRLMKMRDEVEVHPGHGAGSLCGAGIGKEPCSTVARERQINPMLQYADESAFVAAVLADLPETPPYFARMKHINQQGAPVLGLAGRAPSTPPIQPAAAAALVADGALVIDLRPALEFTDSHPAGAINLPFGTKVGYWAGWVLPADEPIVLVCAEAAQADEAGAQLLRVGLDRVMGHVAGGFDAWRAAGLPTESIESTSAAELRASVARGEPLTVLDVRTAREWRSGHIDGSINVPVGDIPRRVNELPREGALATICESGYRSSLAASLLAHEGLRHVISVADGMAAYRVLETT